MFQRSYTIRKYCTRKLGLRLYDGREKEKIPLRVADNLKPFLSFYTCGPTVYDSAHIGHASCYVRLDILQRIMRHNFRLPLLTAMNITDIDDKIITRASERGIPWQQLARRYEDEFWSDLNKLNVRSPDIKLRVTEHIPAIARFVKTLIDKGFAYHTSDGSIYFETSKYERYGKLQKVIMEQASATVNSQGGKRHPSDFALWKASKPGEPFWATNFGNGRPGWHIECSTMASHVFGSRLDFHAGGLDLRFPHHENEETQSCCYHDVPDWVTHWIHTGQLHLEGQTHKMSKSLKNTISVAELLEKYEPDEFRMLCLLSHYRSAIEFGPESMTTATNVLRKFSTFFGDSKAYIDGLKPASFGASSECLLAKLVETRATIDGLLENDFNTASSILALGDLVSAVQKSINGPAHQSNTFEVSPLIGASNVGAVLAVTEYIREQLLSYGLCSMGNSQLNKSIGDTDNNSLERVVDAIVKTRSEIRQRAIDTKDQQLFHICDQLRDSLKHSSIEVKDHGKTSSWTFLRKV